MPRPIQVLLLLIALATAAPSWSATAPARILFLRHGDLWSAAADGSDQRTVVAAGGSIVRYRVAPKGDQVAVVRKAGALDALEIHDLGTSQVTLVRAAEGLVGDLAWGSGKVQSLGYLYQPTPEEPLALFVSPGTGPGKACHSFKLGERLMALYPSDGGVVLVTRTEAGLHWNRCTPAGETALRGYPGKTISSMPLGARTWLTTMYAPGVGRTLALMQPTDRGELNASAAIDLPRSDIAWSHAPAWLGGNGAPTKLALRQDLFEVNGGSSQRVLVWDVASGKLTPVVLAGQILLGTPEPEPGGKRFVVCTQHRDGSGYGTPPALWGYLWNGEGPSLLVAEASDPQWWTPTVQQTEMLAPPPVPETEQAPHEEEPADETDPIPSNDLPIPVIVDEAGT